MKLPRNFIPLALGSFLLLTSSILGINHLKNSKEIEIENISRETTKKIEGLRLRANTRALNKISSELQTHEKALEQLREIRKNSSSLPFGYTHVTC